MVESIFESADKHWGPDSLVQSESGNASARAMGLPQAPITLRQSVDAILDVVSDVPPLSDRVIGITN